MNADLLVLGSAGLAGLLGSAHCAAMCGGIATGFTLRSGSSSWLDALEPNLGRVLGYGLAGLAAGLIGHGVVTAAGLPWLARALRAATGLLLIVVALRLLDQRGRLAFLALPGRLGLRWLRPLQQRFRPTDRGARRVLAGMLWGWLPCGLSGTVLAAAWSQGNAPQAAMTMVVFGLGTLPAMVPLTWSGARIGQQLQRGGVRIVAAALVLAAGLLTLAAPWLAAIPVMHRVLVALGCRSLQS
jgi:uncharacterized protein